MASRLELNATLTEEPVKCVIKSVCEQYYQEACGAVACELVFGSGGHRFKPHCSQHVVVSLGKTLHPKLLLWGLSTVLSM